MSRLSVRCSLLLGAGVLIVLLRGITVSAQPASAEPSAEAADVESDELLTPEENPVADAVLALPRRTPADHFRAAVTLIDLGEPELAQSVLDELTSLNLSPADRAALVHQFGSHRMLQVAGHAELGPSVQEFAESCMAAAADAARDPDRLAELAAQLSDAAPEIRRAALVDLAEAGIDSVRFLVEALAREEDGDRRSALSGALVALQPLSTGPLLAVLTTTDEQLRADVLNILSESPVRPAMPLIASAAFVSTSDGTARAATEAFRRLTGRQVSPSFARELLHTDIRRYRDGMLPFESDAEGRIEMWFWNEAAQQLSSESYPAQEATLIWAAQLAESLYRLDAGRADQQHLAVLLGLESAKLRQGYTTPVDELSMSDSLHEAVERVSSNADDLSRLLGAALENSYPGAAMAAAELLGRGRDASVLYTVDGRPSPLARAVASPDRRVSFSALEAIVALDPTGPFPGSSRVPKRLGFFARGAGPPVALVAMPTLEQAATVGGILNGLGYTPEAFNRGIDLVRQARQAADAEFALIDMHIQAPAVREVLFQVRSMASSRTLPIGLLAPAGRLADAQQIAGQHDRVIAFSRPHSTEAVEAIVAQLAGSTGRSFVSASERVEQAIWAVESMGRLMADSRTFYDLRQQAPALQQSIYLPEVAGESIAALASLELPAAQRTLVDYASREAVPVASRGAAADAFEQNVRQHGVLLTAREILRQYDRYNASATADADTQQVLGRLLDTIEEQRTRSNGRQVPRES